LHSRNNPRNISNMSAVISFMRLAIEQNSEFLEMPFKQAGFFVEALN